ncbi:MAG: DUF2062 domain-containing protein [Thermodesulfobacteriota bacterium]|nr:DUF2062 domain-containing protein [Thermodesulfobacteriota bacterium]
MYKNENRNQIISNNKVLIALKKGYRRFLKIRGHPNEIALGLALGLFVGMTPSMGFHTAIAVFLAALFKWNKISAAVGVWVTNPLTAPIIYGVNYFIGAKLIGLPKAYLLSEAHGFTRIYKIMLKAPEIFWALIIGGIVLGLPLAVAGYYFSYSVVQKYQDDIKQRLARSKEKLAQKKEMRIRKKMEKDAAVIDFKMNEKK